MSSLFKNFNRYAKYGTVPAAKNNSEVPQNSFYKSVHYIDNVVGPVKNVALGSYQNPSMIQTTTFALANVILQPLYLALAYLSYWPAKGLAKVVGSYDFAENTKSLIDYSSMLSLKAWNHSGALSEFVNAVLNYAVSAVIWAAALVVTPLVWTIDKVASKFSDANAEGVSGPSFSK